MGAQATLPVRVTQRRLNAELTPTTCSRNCRPSTCSTRPVANPYCWKGRLLVAAYEVAEHVLQFWARVVHLCPLLEADRPVHLQAVRV